MKDIYEKLYKTTGYGNDKKSSPGCYFLDNYRDWIVYPAIDIGCGAGLLVQALRAQGNVIDGIDYIDLNNGMIVGDATVEQDFSAYTTTICCDVFEHIVPGLEIQLITNMSKSERQVISIHNGPSTKYDGKDLHINIRTWDEWEKLLKEKLKIKEKISISENQTLYLCLTKEEN